MLAASARKSMQTARYAEKQAEILHVATQLMIDRGIRGFTMGDVAERSGLIPQGVVYYFSRKDDLASACIEATVRRLREMAMDARTEPTAAERVRRFFRTYFAARARMATGDEPPMAPLHELRALSKPAFDRVASWTERLVVRLTQLLDGPELEGVSFNSRLARAHFMLNCALSVPGWESSATAADYARSGEKLVDILLGGLAPPGSAWTPPLLPPIHSQETPPREAFLRAATQLINDQGYRGASVAKISRLLQRTKGAFYHHNDAKDDVVTRCFQRTIALFGQAQFLAGAAPVDGLLRLMAAARSLAEFHLSAEGPLLRTSAIYASPADAWPLVGPQWQRMIRRFSGMVSDGVTEGSIRPVDPIVAGELVMVAVNSAGEFSANWLPDLPRDEVASLYVRSVFMGILTP